MNCKKNKIKYKTEKCTKDIHKTVKKRGTTLQQYRKNSKFQNYIKFIYTLSSGGQFGVEGVRVKEPAPQRVCSFAVIIPECPPLPVSPSVTSVILQSPPRLIIYSESMRSSDRFNGREKTASGNDISNQSAANVFFY